MKNVKYINIHFSFLINVVFQFSLIKTSNVERNSPTNTFWNILEKKPYDAFDNEKTISV